MSMNARVDEGAWVDAAEGIQAVRGAAKVQIRVDAMHAASRLGHWLPSHERVAIAVSRRGCVVS